MTTRPLKRDIPGLRAAIRDLRLGGMTVPRKQLSAEFGVGQHTVQRIREEIDHELAMGIEEDPIITARVDGCQVNVWKILSDIMTRLQREQDYWTPMSLAQANKIEQQLEIIGELLAAKREEIRRNGNGTKGRKRTPA